MYLKAKNKALNILSKADQAEKKIREKLSTDFEEDTINRVIEFLKKNNFINDNLLAQKIVNTNLNLNRYERVKNEDKRKVYQKLSQHLAYKGFNYDIIKRVLNKLLNYDEYDI